MMKLFLSTGCLAGALVFGQPVIAPPQIAIIQDSNHSLRQVLGLAANFVLGDSLGEGVVSSAFSGSFGIVKKDTSILVLDRTGELLWSMGADAGPALFAFSGEGAPAFVYLPQSQILLQWASDHLEPTPFNADQIGGVVLAIASRGGGLLSVVANRDDGVWLMDIADGRQSLIPAVTPPVLLRDDGSLLYASPEGFLLRQADGSEVIIGGAGVRPTALEHMGADWVHVTEQDSSRHYAIRLAPGNQHIFQLPEAQQ